MFHRDGGEDSDSDSDLSQDEECSLSIPSSESEDNVRLRGRIQRRFKRSNHSERLLTEPAHNGTKDLDGNDLLSYWPALEECEAHSLQKWGSERRLGADLSKDAANNNNQPDAALTSGDESGLTQPHRHRKGILKNRLGCPPALQGLSSMGRVPSELSWYRTSTLGHRAVPAASYGRMYSGTGSLSQPASRYSSREHLDSLARRQLSRDPLGRQAGSRDGLEHGPPSRHGSRDNLDLLPRRRDLGLERTARENLGGSRGTGWTPPACTPRGRTWGAARGSTWRATAGRGAGPRPAGSGSAPSRPDSPRTQSRPTPPLPRPPSPSSRSLRTLPLDAADWTPPLPVGTPPPAPPSRHPSNEHLDILSSILASFSSSVLAPPTPPPVGPSPSPPHSATSHSISEISPDTEVNRSEGQS
ncbi:hypothetical protein AGOR_G00130790 [Albula goreensis]|uniref:Uncharacterized protein n=1 Tax=Albula goreensis TaxID=1534307 RepID=A0A8T3D804_9TELE|nr:hypothetical protein AGOR_G00130790 [Albula goreensis]